jgi:hypothetical protein
MPKEKTIAEIVSIQNKFDSLMTIHQDAGKVYTILAKEFAESRRTISGKVNMNGAYRDFKNDVLKLKKVRPSNNPITIS